MKWLARLFASRRRERDINRCIPQASRNPEGKTKSDRTSAPYGRGSVSCYDHETKIPSRDHRERSSGYFSKLLDGPSVQASSAPHVEESLAHSGADGRR